IVDAVRHATVPLAGAMDRLAAHPARRRTILSALEVSFPVLSVTAAAAIVYSGNYAQWSSRLLGAALILIALQLAAGLVTGAFAGGTATAGAGEAGSAVIKTIQASPRLAMDPVAAVDDDRSKRGSRLHGVPVVGPVRHLPRIVEQYRADEIVISIPSASGEQMRRVVDACVAARVPFRIAPDPEDLLNGHHRHGTLRVLQPSDLLGRPDAELNLEELRAELHGARVVVTGAAGSIGSELTRQLIRLGPAVL